MTTSFGLFLATALTKTNFKQFNTSTNSNKTHLVRPWAGSIVTADIISSNSVKSHSNDTNLIDTFFSLRCLRDGY